MAIRPIIKYPNSSLRVPTQLVEWPQTIWPVPFSEHLNDLRDTLHASMDGLAIASNQIDEHGFRVFMVNQKIAVDFPLEIVVNPHWEKVAGAKQITAPEGCLSFPGLVFDIPRWSNVLVTCCDIDGAVKTFEVSGINARMVQHECDHLDGKLFVEQLSKKVQIDVRNEVIRRRKAGRW
jgi:peptide deformylase